MVVLVFVWIQTELCESKRERDTEGFSVSIEKTPSHREEDDPTQSMCFTAFHSWIDFRGKVR